jgi:hypothetical protein
MTPGHLERRTIELPVPVLEFLGAIFSDGSSLTVSVMPSGAWRYALTVQEVRAAVAKALAPRPLAAAAPASTNGHASEGAPLDAESGLLGD